MAHFFLLYCRLRRLNVVINANLRHQNRVLVAGRSRPRDDQETTKRRPRDGKATTERRRPMGPVSILLIRSEVRPRVRSGMIRSPNSLRRAMRPALRPALPPLKDLPSFGDAPRGAFVTLGNRYPVFESDLSAGAAAREPCA